jgi:hypothetical protein
MSMHLEGPWLSTQGKKKGRHKFRSAEDKQRAQQLAADWTELQKKYPVKPARKLQRKTFTGHVNINAERSTRHIPSLDTGLGTTAPVPTKQYTGDKMIGIGTMHKSNMVPIFSDKEAREISTMRRG